MAVPLLKYAIGNAASTTLSSSMTTGSTTTPLTSTTNFQAATVPGEGMILLDEGAATEELAYSTGVSGGNLTTPLANRGLEGGSAQAHASGVTVKGVLTQDMWNDLISVLVNGFVQSTGLLDTTKVVDLTTAQTLTTKRVTPRIGTVADAATITPTGDASDVYTITALAQAATIAAPSGTPTNGQKLIIRFLDNNTGRALTWNSIYVAIGITLPTTTTANKYTYVGFIYNSASVKWDGIAVVTQS